MSVLSVLLSHVGGLGWAVQLMQASEGDDGWDVFALTYKVDTPVNAVLTPAAMDRYLRIFNFLWRLKRVEYSLCNTWCRHMTATHTLKVCGVVVWCVGYWCRGHEVLTQ